MAKGLRNIFKSIATIILLSLLAACADKVWYRPGATQQDFYRSQGYCHAQAYSVPGGSSVVGTMLQQSAVFDSCMEGQGYIEQDKMPTKPASLTTATAPSDPISNDPNMKVAYCLGNLQGTIDALQKAPSNLVDTPTKKSQYETLVEKTSAEAKQYKAYLTERGMYSADLNRVSPNILKLIDTGRGDAAAMLMELFDNPAVKACVAACPNDVGHEICYRQCIPNAAAEQRFETCDKLKLPVQ